MERYVLNAGGPEREQVRANAHAFIDRLPASKSWKIEIKEYRKERTTDQNAALFGLAYPIIAKATGNDVDDLHQAFCGKAFGWVDVEVMGEVRRRPRRTTTTNDEGERSVLSTIEFADFWAMVQRISAECGIDVPDPDPFYNSGRFAA
jgi:hypothetical protein